MTSILPTPTSSTNGPTSGNKAAGTSGADSTADAASQLASNFDMFLKLLTTQLKNQDPLQPQDSAAFTQQLVQFSSVEQSIGMNKRLDQLIAANTGNTNTAALDYMGKVVEYQDSSFALQNGNARMAVTLGGQAASAGVVFRDSTGKVVATQDLPTDMGTNVISWNGKDDNGQQLPDGTYTAQIVAKAGDGSTVPSVIHQASTVTGVDLSGDTPMLMMGNMAIEMDKILSIRTTL